jgi:hypothetical protein
VQVGFGTLARGTCVLALAICLLAVFPAHAQSGGGVLPRPQLEALLAESGKALENLRAARAQPVPRALANREDRRGVTFKDDLQQNVLTPEAENRLQSLQERAASDLQAGDLPGAQLAVADLRRELTIEIERFKAITEYWKEKSSLKPAPRRPDWVARNDTLRSSGIEPPPQSIEAAALETQLHQQIAAREFAAAMNVTWPKFQETAKRARVEESQMILARLDNGELQKLPSALPTQKCIPAKETSHTDSAAPRIKDFPSSGNYIAKAARGGAFGKIATLIVVVDSRGCPERSLLVGPSGHAAVDAGALRFLVDGYYLPAERDGVATRSAYPMNFMLQIHP